MNPALVQRLFQEIDRIPIIDIHTHVPAGKPFARHLGDIIGYHYYTELANAAEYRPNFAQETKPDEVVKQVVERLPRIANTVQYNWLMVIGEEFLGIHRHEWVTGNWAQLVQKAQDALDSNNYRQKTLERSGISKVYMTNQCDEDLSGVDTNLYVPCLRTDSFVFEIDKHEERERLSRAAGLQIASAADFESALATVFDKFVGYGMAYAAISTWPGVETTEVTSEEASAIFERVAAGEELSGQARMRWAAYALNQIAANCRRVRRPFHLMVGVRRGAYPLGVSGGRDLMDSVSSLRGYDYLFNHYSDVSFPVSVLADTTGLELASSAWIRHNVYPSGHWWYSNNPVDIGRELRRRLAVVPLSKLLGYYSDAYCIEFILPKFRMYKFELAKALAENIEDSKANPNRNPVAVGEAVDMARSLLEDNPKRLFAN